LRSLYWCKAKTALTKKTEHFYDMPGFEQEGDGKMTLTPEQKQLVRSTWALVKPIQEDTARLFYDRLFEIDPSTKPLFASTDMAKQGKKLMQTINVAVAGLERLDAILPAVEALGRRHVGYGLT